MSGTVAIIAVDPALRRTGIAILEAQSREVDGRLCLDPSTRRIVALLSGGARADGALSWLFSEAAGFVTLGIPWLAAVERPPPANRGQGRAPTVAEHDAIRWLDGLARERAAALGRRYVRPTILRPRPQEWRGPQGLATSAPLGVGRTKDERSAWLKAQSVRLAELELRERRLDLFELDSDSAEALCIALWAVRQVGPAGQWIRPMAAPVTLRAVA